MNQQNEDDPKHSHNAPDRYDWDGSRTRESLHLATASLMREAYMRFPHGPGQLSVKSGYRTIRLIPGERESSTISTGRAITSVRAR